MTAKGLVFLILQLFLFLVFIAVPGGIAAAFIIQLSAFILVISGTIISATAMLQLGSGLTPLPAPRSVGKLITRGVYKYIRHPVYTGIFVITSGISIYSLNIPRVIISLLILVLFYYKSIYEELLLQQRYPDYNQYKTKTGRFFPKMWFQK